MVQDCRDNIEAEKKLRQQLLLTTAVAQAKEAAASHNAKNLQLEQKSDAAPVAVVEVGFLFLEISIFFKKLTFKIYLRLNKMNNKFYFIL